MRRLKGASWFAAYLLGFVVAVLVAVGEVERCELLSQCLLGARDDVQRGVQFSVTRSL